MTAPFAHVPTQAAEFSGPAKHAIVLYAPEWSEALLDVLRMKPLAYEASWSFNEERRAHVLMIAYEGGPTLQVALVDGIHNQVLALLVRGSALVLSPFPLYKEYPEQAVDELFSPEESLLLPELPSPVVY